MFLTKFRNLFFLLALAGPVLAQDKAAPVLQPTPKPASGHVKFSTNFASESANFSIALPADAVNTPPVEKLTDTAVPGTQSSFLWTVDGLVISVSHIEFERPVLETAAKRNEFVELLGTNVVPKALTQKETRVVNLAGLDGREILADGEDGKEKNIFIVLAAGDREAYVLLGLAIKAKADSMNRARTILQTFKLLKPPMFTPDAAAHVPAAKAAVSKPDYASLASLSEADSFSSVEKGFSIRLPRDLVIDDAQNTQSPNPVTKKYTWQFADGGFTVSRSKIPALLTLKPEQMDSAYETLTDVKAAGELISLKKIQILGTTGREAVHKRADTGDQSLSWMVIIGDTIYMLVARHQTDNIEQQKAARAVFASFTLLPQK